MSLADLIAGKLPTAVASVAKVARVAVANPAERKSAKPTTAREPAIEAVPVVSKRKSAETIQPTPQPESVNALLSGAVATATFATLATQGHTEPLPGGGVATATVATPATHDREAMRAALAEAGEGLPVTVAELVEAFGAEGEADWTEGYEAHCRPEFLRAFAEAVAERLERERRAKPEPPRQPHPLDGLALLREDWAFVERRTGGRNREALLNQYAERWKAAAALEPVEFRQANAGRRAANAWLREATR